MTRRCLRTSDEQRPTPIDDNRTAIQRIGGDAWCQRLAALAMCHGRSSWSGAWLYGVTGLGRASPRSS